MNKIPKSAKGIEKLTTEREVVGKALEDQEPEEKRQINN